MFKNVYIITYVNLQDGTDQDLIGVYTSLNLLYKHLFESIIPCIDGDIDLFEHNWFDSLEDFILQIYEVELNILHIFNPKLMFSIYNYKSKYDKYQYSVTNDYKYIMSQELKYFLSEINAECID